MSTKKRKTYSSDICNASSNVLKNNTTSTIYNQYEKHIKEIAKQFTTSQIQLLSQILKLKDTMNFTIETKEVPLDKYNQIPPFIEIFKYLLTKPEFLNKFTTEEQNELNTVFISHHTSHHTSNHNTIYTFLDKSPLGKKISNNYYYIGSHLKKELLEHFPSIEFHSLLINSFTSYKIIEDLEKNIKSLITFTVLWKGKRIENLVYMFKYGNHGNHGNHSNHGNHNSHDINIVSGQSKKGSRGTGYKDADQDKYKYMGTEIIKRILFFNEFLGVDTLPNRFIVFLTNKKKEIDDNVMSQMHFKTININTAVTNSHDIIIFREQELLKSIFHEQIHFHNLDFREIPQSIIDYLLKTHNINKNNKYLLYECMTETLANILNNLFLVNSVAEFQTNLVKEIMFSTLQVSKILKVCGYKKWNEFATLDIEGNHNDVKTQFKQDSCVFSYYILKLYIMLNLDTYFKINLDSKMKFIQSNNNFTKLIELFDNARTKNGHLKAIMDSLLGKKSRSGSGKGSGSSSRKVSSKKINKTLRMTCLEDNIFIKNAI